MAAAALLGGAEVGVNRLPGSVQPAGQLGAHIVAAFAAVEDTRKQRHIAPRLAVAFGPIQLQNVLRLHPFCARDDPRVLAHRDDPLVHGLALVCLAVTLQGAVIGHDAVLAVKGRRIGKQLHMMAGQVLVGIVVCYHIDRIGQDALDGKAGEGFPSFGPILPFQQKLIDFGQGTGLQKLVENQFHQIDLVGNGLQFAGFAHLTIHRYPGNTLRLVTGGRVAAQPAPRLGQLVHIVPDALRDGLPLQLGEHRSDVHHGPPHRGRGVELLPDRDKVDLPLPQVLDQLGEVADVAADAVQAVDHNGGKLLLMRVGHHLFKLGALQCAARKALVLVDQRRAGLLLAVVGGNVLAAHLHLIFNALTLARKLGFSGVNDKLPRLWTFHGAPPPIKRYVSVLIIP